MLRELHLAVAFEFVRPLQVPIAILVALALCLCGRIGLRRCIRGCRHSAPLRRVDASEKYAVQIPEGPSVELFSDFTDLDDLGQGEEGAGGAGGPPATRRGSGGKVRCTRDG